MWEQNLGVSITVENLEPDRYYDLLNSGQHGRSSMAAGARTYQTRRILPTCCSTAVPSKTWATTAIPALDAILNQTPTSSQNVTRQQLGFYRQT